MVSQWRYAPRRHSSIQAGSLFLAEMKRTVSSQSPFGARSDSISVSTPYLYWSASIRRTCSTVSCTAGISFPPLRFQGPRVGSMWVVYGQVRFRRSPIAGCGQAARPRLSLESLDKLARSFIQASRNRSISFSLVLGPILSRIAPEMSLSDTPMAASTWEAVTLPDEQAEP